MLPPTHRLLLRSLFRQTLSHRQSTSLAHQFSIEHVALLATQPAVVALDVLPLRDLQLLSSVWEEDVLQMEPQLFDYLHSPTRRSVNHSLPHFRREVPVFLSKMPLFRLRAAQARHVIPALALYTRGTFVARALGPLPVNQSSWSAH